MFTVDALLKHHTPRLAALPLVASPCHSLLSYLLKEKQLANSVPATPMRGAWTWWNNCWNSCTAAGR